MSRHRDDHDCAAPANGAPLWTAISIGAVAGFALFFFFLGWFS